MDGVFLTEVDCPVGMVVIQGGVDTVAVGVGCAGITIDGCAAVVGEIRVGGWRVHGGHAAGFTYGNIFWRQNTNTMRFLLNDYLCYAGTYKKI